MSVILEQALHLPLPERTRLVEDIWTSLESDPGWVEIPAEQRAELERRMEDFRLNPGGNIPWETVMEEALARK